MSRKLIRTGNGTAQAQRVHVAPKSLQHSRGETTYTGTRNVDIKTGKTPTACWQETNPGTTFIFSNGLPIHIADTETAFKDDVDAGYWINNDNSNALSWSYYYLYHDGKQVYTGHVVAAAIASGFYVITNGTELLVYNGNKFIASTSIETHHAAAFNGTGDYFAVFNKDTRKVTGYRLYISKSGVSATQVNQITLNVPQSTRDTVISDAVYGSATVSETRYSATMLFFSVQDNKLHVVFRQDRVDTATVFLNVLTPGTVSARRAEYTVTINTRVTNKHQIYDIKSLAQLADGAIDDYTYSTQSTALISTTGTYEVTTNTSNSANGFNYDYIDPLAGVVIKHNYLSSQNATGSLVWTGSGVDYISTNTVATSRSESTDIAAEGVSSQIGSFSASSGPTTTTTPVHNPANPFNAAATLFSHLAAGHVSWFEVMGKSLTRGTYGSFDGNTCLLQTPFYVAEGNNNYAKAILAFKKNVFSLVDLKYISSTEQVLPVTIGLL